MVRRVNIGDHIAYADSKGHYAFGVVVGGRNPWPDKYKRIGVRWIDGPHPGKVRFPVIKNITVVEAVADETESFFV